MQSRGAHIALSLISGILMIVLGVLFLARPGLSLASVILLVGVFTIVYGVALAIAGLMGSTESRGWSIALGVLAVIIGIMVLAWPGATSLAVLYMFAAWALVGGIIELAGAFMGGQSPGQRVWLVILGLLGIALGIALFVHPVTGILALLWLAGIYLVVLGILRIVAGFTGPPAEPV
jgi:uncharacterized membrane protein HdeD (DUF308 family)